MFVELLRMRQPFFKIEVRNTYTKLIKIHADHIEYSFCQLSPVKTDFPSPEDAFKHTC